MKNKIRVRMAPSPTGDYHIGHIRTLLYNWAFAKKNKGNLILRIEDTDRERYIEGAVEKILGVINDYGLSWDEGPKVGGPYAPYEQSKRLDIYQKYAKILIEKDSAYYCFCSKDKLEEVRKQQQQKGLPTTTYDKHCRNLPKQEINNKLNDNIPFVVRLKVPTNKKIEFTDLVLGNISVNSNDLDDQVLLKSDGYPTYHFAVVIDDHLMKVTHVMRGTDWIPSTPKHILLYDAFGWPKPKFAHLPNLKELGSTKKLSKRFGPVTAREFLDGGYLPEAVLNFLMFLGWNPGTEKEIYSLDEFVKDFSIDGIHKTDLVSFDRKKLDWINAKYIANFSDSEFVNKISTFYNGKFDDNVVKRIAPLVKTRIKILSEFADIAGFFFKVNKVDRKLLSEGWEKHLQIAHDVLDNITKWKLDEINKSLISKVDEAGFNRGKFFMNLRIAITGSKITPPINESIELLGKKESILRLKGVLSQ